ncbi:universal stress protein [Mucilaginibacter pedocola]|uniref:UspA domain-containing protein n=1 Tax=Mucilaginibacter pedocola TaxID=1792845 RepID=A0A1S9PCT4_9SPHI|nr:universal stress protein [Mucilaginibacter pedocola]OOQ58731.1 hypothetical protein BC343_08715 [Mucilaginibacter pedocola]
MKTILVPTDFSPAATNAAKYALNIAINVKAEIKLCNAVTVPAESVYAAQVAWPMDDYTALKESADSELIYQAGLLEDSIGEGYHPRVCYSTGVGNVTDYVRNLVEDDDVNLVVMGMSGANMFSKFLLGSNSRSLIDKADFPLLLIPKQHEYQSIKRIGFATDLSSADIDALNSVANFARYFNAEIVVSHVMESPEEHRRAEDFLSEVGCKINYPHIYYRGMQNEGVTAGLKWLTENGQIDMLVMIHRPHGIFDASYTQKLAVKTKIPLMVLPDGFSKVLI